MDFYVHEDPNTPGGITKCNVQKGKELPITATTGIVPPKLSVAASDHEKDYYSGCKCQVCFNRSRRIICASNVTPEERREHAMRCAKMSFKNEIPGTRFWRREMRWSITFAKMTDGEIVSMKHAYDH